MTRTNLLYLWVVLITAFFLVYGYQCYISATTATTVIHWEYYNYALFFTLGIMTTISVCNMSTFPYFMTGVPKTRLVA